MANIYSFLEQHSIPYQKHEHPAVFTCEESNDLVPQLPGANTKNLFVKCKKGNLYLIIVGHAHKVDLKALGILLNAKNLSFASAELLQTYLGVIPGAATVLGLMHDEQVQVQVVFDATIWHAEAILCHPLVNTATLILPHAGLVTFLQATGHTAKVLDVPKRSTNDQ